MVLFSQLAANPSSFRQRRRVTSASRTGRSLRDLPVKRAQHRQEPDLQVTHFSFAHRSRFGILISHRSSTKDEKALPTVKYLGIPSGTPLTSPRTNPPPYRTPRTTWANASPATDRRSPADSIIDVTTVTEPPSSEPQIPPPKRLSEVAIQTEDADSQDALPQQLAAHGTETVPVTSQQSTPQHQSQPELVESQLQTAQRLQIIQHASPSNLQQKTQLVPQPPLHPQHLLQAQTGRVQCMQQTPQLQPVAAELVQSQPPQSGSQNLEEPQQPELIQGSGRISTLVSTNLQIVPAHQFALPNGNYPFSCQQ